MYSGTLSQAICAVFAVLAVLGRALRLFITNLDGTRAEHRGARVYLEYIIVAMLSPQLLIPPHSVQAEASGGTVDH